MHTYLILQLVGLATVLTVIGYISYVFVNTRRRNGRKPAHATSRKNHTVTSVVGLLGMTLVVAACSTATTSTAKPAPNASTSAPVTQNAPGPITDAKPYNPVTRNVAPGPKHFVLTTAEQRVRISGTVYNLWTFNGTSPGPALRVVQGDRVTITIKNAASSRTTHSIDFHASRLSMGGGFMQVAPGSQGTFTFVAKDVGVLMYNCATAPVLMHIGSGMYGMIIVQPKGGFKPAMPEFAMVQSELYTNYDNMLSGKANAVAFNGIPNQYSANPIKLPKNSNVRLFFQNAGPDELSSFHVVGTIFDKVYLDGNPKSMTYGRQAIAVPASGSGIFEMNLTDEGKYPIVSHQFNDVALGAVAMMVTGDGVPGAGKPAPDESGMPAH